MDAADIKIEDAGFSTRVFYCFVNDGIKTLGQVSNKNASDLLRIPNFGRKSLKEVIDVLTKYKLSTDYILENAKYPISDGLKPCPFCGSKSKHDQHDNLPAGWYTETDHWISCEADDCGAHTAMHPTRERAIVAWNRRDK